MIRWSGSTTRRYPGEPLNLAGTRGTARPFTGVTPIRAVRRPGMEFTRREIARSVAFAVLMGVIGWAGTVLALSAGR